jgi:hypothetical protein
VLNVYNEEHINLKDESNYRDLSLPLGAITEEGRIEA